MADELADVVGGDGQDERLAADLEQVDEHFEQLAVLLDEARRVVAPETLRLVHRTPLETTRLDLGGVPAQHKPQTMKMPISG